jgi:hypothetical protein
MNWDSTLTPPSRAAGLQTAAGWLRRHPDPVSLRAALTVGAVAGLAVLGGHARGLAARMASALSLAYRLAWVRSGSTRLGRNRTP